MNTVNCTLCGDEVRPQQYHDPYTCRSCRAATALGNEIEAARKLQQWEYVRGLLVAQGLLKSPELAGV